MVALAVTGLLSAQTTQTISITAVTNSADFQPGLPQKGSLASIFTTDLQGGHGAVMATQYPLSKVLGDISVWINFLPAPILSIAFESGYQQINVQVPWESQRQPLYVEVFQNGVRAHTEGTQAVGIEQFLNSSPASADGMSVFFSDASGRGILQHASDYSLVTEQNPAHPGEYLIAYGINLGPVTNQPSSGTPAPSDPLAKSIPQAYPGVCSGGDTVTVGSSKNITPSFEGLAPGTVGLYQINFQVPDSVGSGDLPRS